MHVLIMLNILSAVSGYFSSAAPCSNSLPVTLMRGELGEYDYEAR